MVRQQSTHRALARKPHVTETEAFWRAEAVNARHDAAIGRRECGTTVEQVRMREAYAVECDKRADAMAEATAAA